MRLKNILKNLFYFQHSQLYEVMIGKEGNRAWDKTREASPWELQPRTIMGLEHGRNIHTRIKRRRQSLWWASFILASQHSVTDSILHLSYSIFFGPLSHTFVFFPSQFQQIKSKPKLLSSFILSYTKDYDQFWFWCLWIWFQIKWLKKDAIKSIL